MLGREPDSDRDGGCPDLADLCATRVWRLVRTRDTATNSPGGENLASFTVGPQAGKSGNERRSLCLWPRSEAGSERRYGRVICRWPFAGGSGQRRVLADGES